MNLFHSAGGRGRESLWEGEREREYTDNGIGSVYLPLILDKFCERWLGTSDRFGFEYFHVIYAVGKKIW